MANEVGESVEDLLATTQLDVSDVILAFRARSEKDQNDLAIRDALILKQQRDLREAYHVIEQLRSIPNDEGVNDEH